MSWEGTVPTTAAAGFPRPRASAGTAWTAPVRGLLLAAIGLYAVTAADVRWRRAELGVRLALGATPAGVRRLVLVSGLRLAAAGAAIGLAVAAAFGRVLGGLLAPRIGWRPAGGGRPSVSPTCQKIQGRAVEARATITPSQAVSDRIFKISCAS